MTDNSENNASRTNNPEFYKNTIWGNGSSGDTYASEATPETINNRDELAERYNIKKYKDHDLPGHRFRDEVNPFNGDYYHMDKFEFYQLEENQGYLAMFNLSADRPLHPRLDEMGYGLYDMELYDGRATYFKIVPYKISEMF